MFKKLLPNLLIGMGSAGLLLFFLVAFAIALVKPDRNEEWVADVAIALLIVSVGIIIYGNRLSDRPFKFIRRKKTESELLNEIRKSNLNKLKSRR